MQLNQYIFIIIIMLIIMMNFLDAHVRAATRFVTGPLNLLTLGAHAQRGL